MVDEKTLIEPITREVLYALVWAEPMLKVAARYKVSSSYLARVCTRMNVPRPERGYWAKLAVGKKPRVPALPEPRGGDQLEWTPGGNPFVTVHPVPHPPTAVPQRAPKIRVDAERQHPLVDRVTPLFGEGRESYWGVPYLKPSKRSLVDLIVTKNCLDKALAFANQLFQTLEGRGYRVVLAPHGEESHRAEVDHRETPNGQVDSYGLWRPGRNTVVYVGTVAIGLTVIEMSERVPARHVKGKYVRETDMVTPKRGRYAVDRGWTSEHNFPTGRLCLQAYSPYTLANWSQRWQETKSHDLTGQIGAIVKALEGVVGDLARRIEEGEREAAIARKKREAEWEESKRKRAEEEAAKAVKDSAAALRQVINAWAEVKGFEAFFADAERRAGELTGEAKETMLERLRYARELIGDLDPLERFSKWQSPEERLEAAKNNSWLR